MISFILSLLIGALAVVSVIVTQRMNKPGNYSKYGNTPDPVTITWARILSGVAGLAAVILLATSMFTSVGTKNVAVITTFGKPSGALSNGLHFKAPWQQVHELSDAAQTDTYASDGGADGKQQGGAQGTCINVRIARQATACVNVSIRWQIREDGVDYLFRNFKDNGAITDNLLLRDLQTAVNSAFVTYDPLGLTAEGNSNQPSSLALASSVLDTMRSDIGKYIDVQSVLIPIFNFDRGTQDKLNQLQQQYAATRVAKQQYLTNTAQADANRALAASVSNSPGVLQSKCLDIVKEAVDNNKSLPAGFSCLGSGTGLAVAVGK